MNWQHRYQLATSLDDKSPILGLGIALYMSRVKVSMVRFRVRVSVSFRLVVAS